MKCGWLSRLYDEVLKKKVLKRCVHKNCVCLVYLHTGIYGMKSNNGFSALHTTKNKERANEPTPKKNHRKENERIMLETAKAANVDANSVYCTK